jgi:hypothetical protein
MTLQQREEFVNLVRGAHENLIRATIMLAAEDAEGPDDGAENGYRLARIDMALDLIEGEIPEIEQASGLMLADMLGIKDEEEGTTVERHDSRL